MLYISLFIFLGFLTQLFIHAVVEQVYIWLLLQRFDIFGLGFSWTAWFTIHTVFAIMLALIGIIVGFWQGMYWWKRLYE